MKLWKSLYHEFILKLMIHFLQNSKFMMAMPNRLTFSSWPFSVVFTLLLSFLFHHTKEICFIKNLPLKRSQEIRLILWETFQWPFLPLGHGWYSVVPLKTLTLTVVVSKLSGSKLNQLPFARKCLLAARLGKNPSDSCVLMCTKIVA